MNHLLRPLVNLGHRDTLGDKKVYYARVLEYFEWKELKRVELELAEVGETKRWEMEFAEVNRESNR